MELASRGKVKIPTMVRVEINAATCAYPPPFFSKESPIEKATNVGIIVIEPIIEANDTPKKPDSLPKKDDIVSGVIDDNIIPTIIIIKRN